MRLSLLFCAAAAILISRSPAFADGCENPTTSYDRTYCLCKLFIEADKELNSVYKELKPMLSKAVQQKLTTVQREWISYRNNSCENSGTIYVECNYDVLKARTEYLRDRLRECKTGHCREDLIGQRSW